MRDAERWQQVKRILDEVLEMDPHERRIHVDEACVGDPSLRADVEFYLELDESRGDFFDRPVFSVRGDGEEEKELDEASFIGPYKVMRRIGRGGMGAVYLARREDDYKKLVAVKLIKRGMDTEEIVRRFRNERQVLAQLEHPNVARLLDGGSTADGRPFLAMEYVEGEPIDRYCDDLRLPVRQRLELFIEVCSAVRFAHQNLVVHRDLKPGNILVTSDGTVKLLDFGIAKVLSGEGDFSRLTTVPERRLMTPWYASPEQVRGERITTASDTYTLGVLLYQLLTGQLPYRTDTRSESEIGRRICEEEPRRPSAAATEIEPETLTARGADAGRLRKLLSGDLDAIVMKAMEKDPRRRYASVEQLAEDVRRHLEGRPITARTGTFTYRTAKFVRRNKVALAVAAVLLSVLVSYGATATLLWNRSERERVQAVRAQAQADRVVDLLVDLFESSKPNRSKGEDLTASEILQRGRERLEALKQTEPEVYATLALILGKVYRQIGDYGEAKKLFGESLEIRSRHDQNDLQVARVLGNQALLLAETGETAEAETVMRRAVSLFRKHYGEDNLELSLAIQNLAKIVYDLDDARAAEELYRESLAMRDRLGVGKDRDYVVSMTGLAAALRALGEETEAEKLTWSALALSRKLFPEEDDSAIATVLNSLGIHHYVNGDYEKAELALREALGIRRRLFGDHHTLYASSLYNLAKVLQAKDENQEAVDLYRRALAIRSQIGESNMKIAEIEKSLADALVSLREPQEAEALARRALTFFRSSEPEKPEQEWRAADARSILGSSLAAQSRNAEAEGLLVESFLTLRKARGDGDALTRDARRRLVSFYEGTGNSQEADRYRER